MSSISIYVVSHKDCFIPSNPIMKPLQVGCTVSGCHIQDMLHDDEGDSISEKNRMYCELTAQYWAWKNDPSSDYIGFFHYRRYLNFSGKDLKPDLWGNIIYDGAITDEVLKELGIDADRMESLIRQYDIIVPLPRTIPEGKNIYDEYIAAKGHHKEDLDAALSVLAEKYPEYAETVEKYMASSRPYEVNMFIMRAELFREYAAWLFDILFRLEKRLDVSSYSQYELRVIGFLSERLFGIWFMHNKEAKQLRTLELQKTLFRDTDKLPGKISTKEGSVVAVLACNDGYVPYLAAMLCSIVHNAKQNRGYELFVLTTDISERNQQKLKSLVEADRRFSFCCINVQSFAEKQELFVHTHISVETYYRFFISSLFPDVEKVLYLDSDMVVNSDIADLYDTDIRDCCLAAAKDIDLAGSIKSNSKLALYVRNEVGCTGADEYFQAGVLLFNIKAMNAMGGADELLRVSQQQKWNYMDQDILNHVYRKKIRYLDQVWNCVMVWKETKKSRMDILKDAQIHVG